MRELPSLLEAERALEFLGWCYEGGHDTALDIYRQRYGDTPNFAVDSPDEGHISAMSYLVDALKELQR